MKPKHTRCLYIADGNQCETWFEVNGSEQFCPAHQNILNFVDNTNPEREFCYQYFKDVNHPTIEEYQKLIAHIADMEAINELQKQKIWAARAVKSEAFGNLSEDERKERLKYTPRRPSKTADGKKGSDGKPKPRVKLEANPVEYFKSKGIDENKARDLLSMDVDDLLAKYAKKKEGPK